LDVDAQVGVVVVPSPSAVDKLCRQLADLAAGPVGLSEVYPSLDQTPAALRQAQLACLAATPESREVVRHEQVPIAVLLVSAPDAAASVAEAILGPVLALPEVERDVLLDTLRLWFAEDGATSAAAAKLHVHRNTVRYRLRRIEDLTGRSLSQPTGTAELHLALEATRVMHVSTHTLAP
jgi:DNA-binding PucR family transcriptional regulator